MTDERLYFLCKKYGEIAVRYRNKFAGLLPEVFRRKLYEKKGYCSIFEFAAKLAGMSQEHVRRVLNLEERFNVMPVLREILVRGEVSVSKLAKVASIATPENQEELARHVRLLPRSALETLVRDEKLLQGVGSRIEHLNGLLKPQNEAKSVPGNTQLQQNFKNATAGEIVGEYSSGGGDPTAAGINSASELCFSKEVRQKLFELQQKGININELLLEFLAKRELEIAQEKERLAQKYEQESAVSKSSSEYQETSPRYIPVAVRKVLKKEYGTKCSIQHCKKSAAEIHHTQRFSISQNHNPQFLAPLCREHHVIAHTVDMQFHSRRMIR